MQNNIIKNNTAKPLRDSNLELLGIFAMLAIIAHHSVVNSGIVQQIDLFNLTNKDIFLEFWGAWGKTAINSFILISGYFLCKGMLTWKKWLKLYFEIQLYSFLIMLISQLTGYEDVSSHKILKQALFPFPNANSEFCASFMIFYAGVPLYNKILEGLSQSVHCLLLVVLLGMFTFSSSFFQGRTMNEPFWYMTLYFVAAYIRLHPCRLFGNLYISLFGLILSISAAIWFIILMVRPGRVESFFTPYWYVQDSNKLLAFAIGLFAFLVAKNMPKFHSKIINFFASGCFGVLLIHASSDTMRRWLWRDLINISAIYEKPFVEMVVSFVAIPIVIYIICSLIDALRRAWIEKPVLYFVRMIYK